MSLALDTFRVPRVQKAAECLDSLGDVFQEGADDLSRQIAVIHQPLKQLGFAEIRVFDVRTKIGGQRVRAARAQKRFARTARGRQLGKPLIEQCRESCGRYRFRDVVVHAGREAFFAVVLQCMGGHGDDRNAGIQDTLACCTDGPSRFQSIHLGHLNVHEH